MIPLPAKGIRASSGEHARATHTDASFLQTLLMVSRHGGMSGALEAAIKREFPWISIRYAIDLRSACSPFEPEAQLILIDVRLISDLTTLYEEMCKRHPWANVAVMIDGDAQALGTRWTCVGAGMVRGIVPFNVNLDVLLSILRILLKGGEYFPASACRGGTHARAASGQPNEIPHPFTHVTDALGTLDLTGRELEILGSVARGQQNKNIAADLGVSEHTVKLHIHNIITKLGVHNRTEAAVRFLERSKGSDAEERRSSVEGGGLAAPPSP